MGTIRNCIDIVGIASENELPKKINGQLVEASETEQLSIDDNIKIKNIYQIIIDANIKKTRVINTPMNKIIVVDIYKRFKIAYYDMNNNMGILELESPTNLFFDMENDKVELEKINLYIADAYFELLNSKILYNYNLYIIDVHYWGNRKKIDNINNKCCINKNCCINNNSYGLYTQNSENNKERVINNVIKEVSVSEDNKIEIQEHRKSNSDIINEFIDIESEYL